MANERTSGGAGLRPAVPPRPVPPEPAPSPTPSQTPEHGAVVERPAPEPPTTTGAIPVEEQPLDPRAIARASLAAGRNASLWWVTAGIVVAVVVSLVVGTRAGSAVLAALVAACAVVRGVLAEPGPVALSVRARRIDVTVLLLLAAGLTALTVFLPHGSV